MGHYCTLINTYKAVPYESEYPELSNGNCLVCNWRNNILELKCECGHSVIFQNDGFATCPGCEKKYEPEDVYSLIDDFGYDTSEWPDNITPANCGFCDGYHTVAAFHEEYICASCLEVFNQLEQCQYCGQFCSGDMEDSYWKGCAVCDGSGGWD